MLERQVRRMLKDPRAEALAENFAGQWLNLRGLQSSGPLPLVYPDFDDPLRQAMRREVELLFDSIVREDRNVVDLLTADYTFVNERLAKHYGIPNVYGSQFRRVTLGPDMEVALGPARQGRVSDDDVEAGAHVAGDARQVDHGQHSRDEPAGSAAGRAGAAARPADATGNAQEPTMRQKMLEHRVRADCIAVPRLMDPIGFSLENFDGIGSWRTLDANQPIDAASQVYDGTKIDGPAGLRKWLLGYSRPVRRGRGGEAADLRARPRRRVSGHAARPLDFARCGEERQPVLGARARRRQEQAVSDEHEGCRTHLLPPGATRCSSPKNTSRAGRFCRARASRWRCRCSTR